MSKETFINELSDKLERLSEDDKKEYLDFFSELIDDKIEEGGESETDAISEMDSAQNIADAIIREIPIEPDENESYIENHSVIDCVNRYRMDDGRYNFTVKIPEDVNIKDVIIELTKDYSGSRLKCSNLFYLTDGEDSEFTIRLENSYDGFNYFELTTLRFSETGLGLRLFLNNYKGKSYMATDTSNKSSDKGNGYWLSA